MKSIFFVISFLVVHQCCNSQIKILFDATKAQTAANADWQIDTDVFNISYGGGNPHTGGNEANPQRFPTPDQSEINASTPENFWKGALSSWAIECVKLGYEVQTLPIGSQISYGNNSNPQDLSNYDIFVVTEPNIAFSQDEITAILTYVENGGGLFMIGNHSGSDRNFDNIDSPAIWNQLMGANNPFGIQFNLNDAWGTSSNIAPIANDPIIDGQFGHVSKVTFSAGSSMTIDPQLNPKVRAIIYNQTATNDDVLVAISEYGHGKVVAFGDSSIPDDGTGDTNDNLYDGWLGDADGNHRVMVMNATLWMAQNPITTSIIKKDVVCKNTNTGTAEIFASGGNGQFQYKWSNGSVNPKIEYLTAGKYTVTVTSNHQSKIDSVTITEPQTYLEIAYHLQNITCRDLGKVELIIVGGTSPYTYLWSNGQTTKELSFSVPSYFLISVTDAIGCTQVQEGIVEEDKTAPNFNIEGDTLLNCYHPQGTLSVAIADNESIHWSGPDINSTNSSIDIRESGTYSVVVTNLDNGCDATKSITVTSHFEKPDLTVIGIDTLDCLKDTIILLASNNDKMYEWSKDNQAISNQNMVEIDQKGIYSLHIFDPVNGCSDSTTFEIFENKLIPTVVIDTVQSNIGMADGEAHVTILDGYGPYTIGWFDRWGNLLSKNEDLLEVREGTYYCVVTGSNGCSIWQDVTITQKSSYVSETSQDQQFQIFPNPVNQVLSIHLDNRIQGELKISNSMGQEIFSSKSFSGFYEIPVNGWPKGCYFATIKIDGHTFSKIFIVN